MTSAAGDATRIPVVLPRLRIEVGGDGQVTAELDGAPYDFPPDWQQRGRAVVPRIVDAIASGLSSPIRVDVIDGGSTFTDIVTPIDQVAEHADAKGPPTPTAGEVLGSGFTPNEPVAVAVVVAHQSADDNGFARLRLPHALLAHRPGVVILLGTYSGAVALSGGSP